MSRGDLPLEVLHNILKFCDGWTVLTCRLVSRQWRDAVDSMADNHWKQVCGNDYRGAEYNAVRNKYRLTWRETYRAVNSWSHWKIKCAKVTAQQLCTKVNRFKVNPGGVIACLKNVKNHRSIGYSDTVVYYDSETYQEIDRQVFNLEFLTEQFEESDDFWVFVSRDGRLCIIPKKNNEQFFVGRIQNGCDDDWSWQKILSIMFAKEYLDFSVIDNKVYFKDFADNIVYESKLVQEDNKTVVCTTALTIEPFKKCVIQFTILNGKLYAFNSKGAIYLYNDSDRKLEFVKEVKINSEEAFIELREFGFDWRSPEVFSWFTSQDHFIYGFSSFSSHSHVTVTSCDFKVCIYFSAFITENLEDLYIHLQNKPTKVIKMDEGFKNIDTERETCVPIKQIDIIETGTKHKIVISGYGRVYILTLDESRRTNMKLRERPLIIKRDIQTLKQSNKVAPINKKRTCTYSTKSTKKHKYNTRSAKNSNSKKMKR